MANKTKGKDDKVINFSILLFSYQHIALCQRSWALISATREQHKVEKHMNNSAVLSLRPHHSEMQCPPVLYHSTLEWLTNN
jgi:hypothetical protein